MFVLLQQPYSQDCSLVRTPSLVNLFLLINAELTRAAVHKKKKAADDGENLEEVVLGKVLVGVMLVKLYGSGLDLQ